MRKLTSAFIAASAAIALAGTAQAQTVSAGRGTPPSATTATTSSSTGTVGSSSATGTPGMTAGTSTSGTSSGDAFTGSSRNASSGQTAGPSISGTSSGDAFSGSSRDNAPAVGAASSANSTNSASPNTPDRATTVDIINANGERVGTSVINPGSGAVVTVPDNSPAMGNASGNAPGSTADGGASGATIATPELDLAVRREAQRVRKTVESKGQMMHSITPRTNVDRTDQMPDDPSPLVTPGRR